MAISNHERVGRGLELLRAGLMPFVKREVDSVFKGRVIQELERCLGVDRSLAGTAIADMDVAGLLKVMTATWNDVFGRTLGRAERNLASELRDLRNAHAHPKGPMSSDDADRGLDSMERLLTSVSAKEAAEVGKLKRELRRIVLEEQVRGEQRKGAGIVVEGAATGTLTPWREVVSPHPDVASGRYQQAEFAADLWQVHIGEGSDEYRKPVEFFRRTYLTDSLRELLVGALRRLSGKGGDPVVQLQTNFGGGKTHSMLALYHMLSGSPSAELPNLEVVLEEAGVGTAPKVNRVVLVGNKISPGNPSVKEGGVEVRTLWGELAWQLGYAAGGAKEARKALARIAADDAKATSPGDALRELMNTYGPCLILVDEWVAYARQLHDAPDLPGGSFETHFSFAQALTESAKAAKACLLVISLPASDTATSPHAVADDVEVGGERGRAALARLRNAIGRVEASWRPASAEEGFEIVRRRLFEPVVDKAQIAARKVVAKEFFQLYQKESAELPAECRDADYEQQIIAAYPIHPEIFERLFKDWSTLVKFQRTRGVLRLMAAVIHSLWDRNDRNPLIQPGNIPIDDPRVKSELTRYLSDNWDAVIGKDVDGPSALPARIDAEVPNLGKYAACRRAARTIYLGSAPMESAANRGIDDRRVKLGCIMPGESPAIFGDALRRLANAATYLYQDGTRYWYSTQPTVTKLAEDRAAQLARSPEKVVDALIKRLRGEQKTKGDFERVHSLPASGHDVEDEPKAGLVILSTDAYYSKQPDSPAEVAARQILQTRGSSPRLMQNTLVFLAVDHARLQDLDDAIRRHLAWESIVAEQDALNLTKQQITQAQTQREAADATVAARIPEAYRWLLVPKQEDAKSPIVLEPIGLKGQGPLAVRASEKLVPDELMFTTFAGTRLRMELDKVLWRGDHVSVKQLVEDYTRYIYLSRMKEPAVLVESIRSGVAMVTWETDTFAYADSYDEAGKRYRGLRVAEHIPLTENSLQGLVVRPEAARIQLDAEAAQTSRAAQSAANGSGTYVAERAVGVGATSPTVPAPASPRRPTRFHATATLDATRVGRDASRIADEVLVHLTGIVGSRPKVTLEIEVEVPEGISEPVARTVSENCRTLKIDFGLESE